MPEPTIRDLFIRVSETLINRVDEFAIKTAKDLGVKKVTRTDACIILLNIALRHAEIPDEKEDVNA